VTEHFSIDIISSDFFFQYSKLYYPIMVTIFYRISNYYHLLIAKKDLRENRIDYKITDLYQFEGGYRFAVIGVCHFCRLLQRYAELPYFGCGGKERIEK
jgi:hypothetical protein